MATLSAALRNSKCDLRFDSNFRPSRVTKVHVCTRRRAWNNENSAEDVQHEHRPTLVNVRGESFDSRRRVRRQRQEKRELLQVHVVAVSAAVPRKTPSKHFDSMLHQLRGLQHNQRLLDFSHRAFE